jgi:hypothetical protein
MLTAFFECGEPVGTWRFHHLDGTPGTAFFGQSWSEGIVGDQLMELPWKVFCDPRLSEPGAEQPYVALQRQDALPPGPEGKLVEFAPALFEAMDVSAPASFELVEPDVEGFARTEFPRLLATLIELDEEGDVAQLKELFAGPARMLLGDLPVVSEKATAVELHVGVCRLLSIWTLVGQNDFWWDIVLPLSRNHKLGDHLRPLPVDVDDAMTAAGTDSLIRVAPSWQAARSAPRRATGACRRSCSCATCPSGTRAVRGRPCTPGSMPRKRSTSWGGAPGRPGGPRGTGQGQRGVGAARPVGDEGWPGLLDRDDAAVPRGADLRGLVAGFFYRT